MRPANAPNYDAPRARAAKSKRPLTLADVPDQVKLRLKTGDDGLDEVLGAPPDDVGLFWPSAVIFAGAAGSGKSSLLMKMVFRMEEPRKLYVTSEETLEEIRERAIAFGYAADLHKVPVLATRELGEVLEAIREQNPRVVIIDSLNDLVDSENDSPTHDMKNLEDHVYKLVDECANNNRTIVMISHMNKAEEIAGVQKIQHRVHTVMMLECPKGTKLRKLHCPQKNRKGRTKNEVWYAMTNKGLVRTVAPSKDDPTDDDDGAAPAPKRRGRARGRVRDAYDEITGEGS